MIKLYKKIAETPLQALKRLRRRRPELADARLSYAGRLDPMACGILPILVGEENDRREDFLGKDKTYTFTILFGFSTDTFDLLGKPKLHSDLQAVNAQKSTQQNQRTNSEFSVNRKYLRLTENKLRDTLHDFIGAWKMRYPPYSAKTVELDGEKKPLWKIARAGRLDEITLPTKQVTIYDLDLLQTKQISRKYLASYVTHYVTKLDGDFRQDEIIFDWKEVLEGAPKSLPAAEFRLRCSAGTYVRRLAQEIGRRLSLGGTTFSLLRTRVSKKVSCELAN